MSATLAELTEFDLDVYTEAATDPEPVASLAERFARQRGHGDYEEIAASAERLIERGLFVRDSAGQIAADAHVSSAQLEIGDLAEGFRAARAVHHHGFVTTRLRGAELTLALVSDLLETELDPGQAREQIGETLDAWRRGSVEQLAELRDQERLATERGLSLPQQLVVCFGPSNPEQLPAAAIAADIKAETGYRIAPAELAAALEWAVAAGHLVEADGCYAEPTG